MYIYINIYIYFAQYTARCSCSLWARAGAKDTSPACSATPCGKQNNVLPPRLSRSLSLSISLYFAKFTVHCTVQVFSVGARDTSPACSKLSRPHHAESTAPFSSGGGQVLNLTRQGYEAF